MEPVQASDRRGVIDATLAEHRLVLEATIERLSGPIEEAARRLVAAYREGGKAILFGNGGSMTDAMHIEGELVGRFAIDRPGVAAVALGSPASFTATANDYSYADVFARMLEAHARPGDVAVGLTTSGNSENVLRALTKARALGLTTISLTGDTGGKCRELSDVCLNVPSTNTPRIQEMHITVGHMLCDLVEQALFGSS